jgi:LysR family transcriptional regulator, hydrogen peroxide-inducible genes activator
LGAANMELHEIRYFLALCKTLNFTRAAEVCNVSQPALTRAIQNLEEKLGAGALVNRERANTHLTELGRIMVPYFDQVLAGIDEAKATAQNYGQGTAARLSIGLMCTIGPARMIEFFSSFHRRHPETQLYLKDAPAAVLEGLLESGDLDLAVYCKPDPLAEKFHLLPLFTERFVIAVAPGHPFARQQHVKFADLHQQRYLHRANCEYNETLDGIMAERGVEPVYPYESERDDWIQSMVLAGLGCSAIPEFALTVAGLVLLPLVEPEVSRTIQLVSVRGRAHTAQVGAFVIAAKQHTWPSGLNLLPHHNAVA